MPVELRGLEPLTFSLRRHRVDLTRREHRVIDVQVAAVEAPWLQPRGTRGAHAEAQLALSSSLASIRPRSRVSRMRGTHSGQGAPTERGSPRWDDVYWRRVPRGAGLGRGRRPRGLHWQWLPWWTSGQRVRSLVVSRS